MSGTSLDGLDVALCSFTNSGVNTNYKILNFTTVPYTKDIQTEIKKVFAKQTIDFEQLCSLNPWIGILHGEMVLECLTNWNVSASTVDIIASHGQTVYHYPKNLHPNDKFSNSTLQIGDGDHIAVKTGIITLSDFRQKHIAAGGEGAPLAVYGDFLLFSSPDENRIMLNIGGVANFTWLPKSQDCEQVFSTDVGPGNTLLDNYALSLFNTNFDRDSQLANKGEVREDLLHELLSHEFYSLPFPKTTGPELFNKDYVENALHKVDCPVKPEDIMATLTVLSATVIANSIKSVILQCHHDALEIYASGGGAHNPLLMKWVHELLIGDKVRLRSLDTLGVSGDAKEALLFATLANEAICGECPKFNSAKGIPSVSMGKLSFPY